MYYQEEWIPFVNKIFVNLLHWGRKWCSLYLLPANILDHRQYENSQWVGLQFYINSRIETMVSIFKYPWRFWLKFQEEKKREREAKVLELVFLQYLQQYDHICIKPRVHKVLEPISLQLLINPLTLLKYSTYKITSVSLQQQKTHDNN